MRTTVGTVITNESSEIFLTRTAISDLLGTELPGVKFEVKLEANVT